jgi:hypothetical protein
MEPATTSHQHDESARPKKPNYSNYIITINTNYRPKYQNDLSDIADKLTSALNNLFTHNHLPHVIAFPKGGNYSMIEDIDVEFGEEVGAHAKGGRLHAHAVVKIKHHTFIKLKPNEISKILVDEIDDERVKSLYVNIRFFYGEQFIQDYIQKTMH